MHGFGMIYWNKSGYFLILHLNKMVNKMSNKPIPEYEFDGLKRNYDLAEVFKVRVKTKDPVAIKIHERYRNINIIFAAIAAMALGSGLRMILSGDADMLFWLLNVIGTLIIFAVYWHLSNHFSSRDKRFHQHLIKNNMFYEKKKSDHL